MGRFPAARVQRLRKNSTGESVGAMLYVPPSSDPEGGADEARSAGRLWWYVSKLFGGSVGVCDLSSGRVVEVETFSRMPAVTCMHLGEDGLLWTGHKNGSVR
jgi:hypothetical protein